MADIIVLPLLFTCPVLTHKIKLDDYDEGHWTSLCIKSFMIYEYCANNLSAINDLHAEHGVMETDTVSEIPQGVLHI